MINAIESTLSTDTPKDVIIRKCPKDGHKRRIYIERNGVKEVAVSDGLGNAYSCSNSIFGDVGDFIKASNFIHPSTYEFAGYLKKFEI